MRSNIEKRHLRDFAAFLYETFTYDFYVSRANDFRDLRGPSRLDFYRTQKSEKRAINPYPTRWVTQAIPVRASLFVSFVIKLYYILLFSKIKFQYLF